MSDLYKRDYLHGFESGDNTNRSSNKATCQESVQATTLDNMLVVVSPAVTFSLSATFGNFCIRVSPSPANHIVAGSASNPYSPRNK